MQPYQQSKLFTLMITAALLLLNTSAFAAENDTNTDAITKIINCDKSANYPALPVIPKFTWQDTGLITIWFDDAWVTAYSVALPIMEKYKFKGAIAVAVKLVCYPPFMRWGQLRKTQALGWETTAHSVMHICDMGYYTTEKTKYELEGSKKMIRAHGLRADHFVMPCGYSREQISSIFKNKYPPIVEMSKEFYHSYRTTKYERINPLPVPDPYSLYAFQIRNNTTDVEIQAQINKAVDEKGWLIIVIHQVDKTERPFSIPAQRFEKILSMIQKSNLPVVLPSQALSIKKRDDTQIAIPTDVPDTAVEKMRPNQ